VSSMCNLISLLSFALACQDFPVLLPCSDSDDEDVGLMSKKLPHPHIIAAVSKLLACLCAIFSILSQLTALSLI
jgi:hypothetical protein